MLLGMRTSEIQHSGPTCSEAPTGARAHLDYTAEREPLHEPRRAGGWHTSNCRRKGLRIEKIQPSRVSMHITASANFEFLKVHEPALVTLGGQAEQYFRSDPNTCLIKLRQFGELLAQLAAARTALFTSPEEAQADLLRRLRFAGVLTGETGELFYKLRKFGNEATRKRPPTRSCYRFSLTLNRS